MRTTVVMLSLGVLSCAGELGPGSATPIAEGDGEVDAGFLCDAPEPDAGEENDALPPGRLLRRAAFALTGKPPTDADYAALEADADQARFVDAWVDAALNKPEFYTTLFEFSREWFSVPLTPSTADAPEYGPQMQRSIQRCAATTPNAGKWAYARDDWDGFQGACRGVARDGGVPEETTLEPWFAPGTTVTLVGPAANMGTHGFGRDSSGGWRWRPCDDSPGGTCGCGPAAANCHADYQEYSGWEDYVSWNENGQRRQLAEESSRLFAHLAWHNRPLDELITGTKMVGTTKTISAYVMLGAYAGDKTMLRDDSWWKPEKWRAAPHDPLHGDNDPNAWREFDLPTVSRVFIADRAYTFDPRTQPGPMRGLPAAGMLTGFGFLAAQPRERLRASRLLEQLACEVLSPPEGLKFEPYRTDPAIEGPCQHCHKRIDPAAIHFKRFAKTGQAFEGWGAFYVLPQIGSWTWPRAWRTGAWPYGGEPFSHWNRWYTADTRMTPLVQPQIDTDPHTVFLDFLPPNQTLLNEVSDGTVGPLGFGKLILKAGAYDRCVVRHLHQLVLGRDLDPAKEAGYLDRLTAEFVTGGRLVKPFVKSLTASPMFKRGF